MPQNTNHLSMTNTWFDKVAGVVLACSATTYLAHVVLTSWFRTSLNTILCVAGCMYYQWRPLVSGALSIARFCVIWENGLNKAGVSEGGEDEWWLLLSPSPSQIQHGHKADKTHKQDIDRKDKQTKHIRDETDNNTGDSKHSNTIHIHTWPIRRQLIHILPCPYTAHCTCCRRVSRVVNYQRHPQKCGAQLSESKTFGFSSQRFRRKHWQIPMPLRSEMPPVPTQLLMQPATITTLLGSFNN